MNRDYIRQIQMIELREFSDNLLSRVEDLRKDAEKSNWLELNLCLENFFEDIEELKQLRYFHNTEDK